MTSSYAVVGVYLPRRNQATTLYRLVEAHYARVKGHWEHRLAHSIIRPPLSLSPMEGRPGAQDHLDPSRVAPIHPRAIPPHGDGALHSTVLPDSNPLAKMYASDLGYEASA